MTISCTSSLATVTNGPHKKFLGSDQALTSDGLHDVRLLAGFSALIVGTVLLGSDIPRDVVALAPF